MKDRPLKWIGFPLTLLLTSCQLFSVSFSPYTDYVTVIDRYQEIDRVHYYQPANMSLTYSDIFRSHPVRNYKTVSMRPTGEQKLLVIPVDFTDYRAERIDQNGGKTAHKVIENAFFGRSDKTQWESVASFYNKSSYGKLVLSGEVAPWYTVSETYSIDNINRLMTNQSEDYKTNITQAILREAVDNYKITHPNYLEYDQDEDGYLDGVFLIYAHPIGTKEVAGHVVSDASSIFWAFSSFDARNNAPLTSPIANAYAWASYEFMNTLNRPLSTQPDAHTYIHEMGHVFGLDDYYNTDRESPYGATGTADLMDYSLGDHTALSKMLLDWTRPFVLKDEGEVELRPFVTTGDLLIIPKPTWNGSAMDEYLAIEYYTPTGLNAFDAFHHQSLNLFDRYGLKVYHINARLGYYSLDGSATFLGYVEDLPTQPASSFMRIVHTNSTGGKRMTRNGKMLYQLLEKSGVNSFLTGGHASNDTLFFRGDQFGITTFIDYRYHDDTPLGYSFSVQSISKEKAIIRFDSID